MLAWELRYTRVGENEGFAVGGERVAEADGVRIVPIGTGGEADKGGRQTILCCNAEFLADRGSLGGKRRAEREREQ
jgi:hypothetical protein